MRSGLMSNSENLIKAIDYDIVYKVGMEFFYKFGRSIIKRLLLKKEFNYPKNTVLKLY